MQSLFFLITTMFQMGINKKITFNKHFARKYIRAYTTSLAHTDSTRLYLTLAQYGMSNCYDILMNLGFKLSRHLLSCAIRF